ncbi:hypothetical protein [Streptomyces sp. H27-H5]|uniref:WXG100-like domain-containing protein n=1 Tax=Streptomyces sp. H27-H5 TaxID=2996460 RepID=UPI0022714E68|nr:hypothetical protein [Streptomyces sp. H27-H5]MCY0960247.1 hypothetical protein [Streptomyces sp. H27-H5]
MSVDMPPELAWVARLAVGQSWPKGNEDGLHALGQAWHEAAQELKGISEQVGASGNGVLESVGGQVADEFRSFVTQLESSIPEMAQSAGQLGKLGRHTAVQVEYSKYMILGQLVLLAAQIAQWAFFAPEVIPLAVTGARIAVKMILRRLLISVATGVAMNVGLDVAVQTIQFLKGDRTEWSTDNTVSAVVSGAIGGAVGGVFFGAGGVLAPKFAHALLGKVVLGAATGVATAGIMYGIYKSGEEEFGSSISAGALGALGGGGRRRFGGKGTTIEVDPVHLNVPDALRFDLPGLPTAEKAALSDPPPSPGRVAPEPGRGGGADPVNGAGTGTGTGTGADGAGFRAPRTESAPAVHGATGDTRAPAAAPGDGGLPGFATVLGPAQGPTASAPGHAAAPALSGAAPSGTAASGTAWSGAHGPGSARTAATAPVVRTSTGTGVGPTAAEVTRPATAGAPGAATPAAPPGGPAAGAAGAAGTGGLNAAAGPGSDPSRSVRTETSPTPSAGAGQHAGPQASAAAGAPHAGPEASVDTASRTGPQAPAATGPHPVPERPGAPVTATTADTADTTAAHTATGRATGTVGAAESAATRDPGSAPPPGHVPGGPTPAPRMALDRTPRFVVRSSFEARRFTYQGESVTDLTVRVAFRAGGGHDTEAVWSRMSDGVREFLNGPEYRLPGGDRLHVTVLRARPGDEPHLTVDLVGRDRGMDQRSWWPDADPVDYAHELAHQIGLRDEYRDPSAPHRPAVEGSLQGDYRSPAPEGLRQAGLRDRHLRLIAALVGDLDQQTGAPRREDPAAAALLYDAEWARAWRGAAANDRSHVWVDPVSNPLRHGQDGNPARDEVSTDDRGENRSDQRTESPSVAPRMFGPPVYSPDNSLIMQPGYASGDQFGILASLLHDPNRHVLIARGPDSGLPGHDPVRDKSRAIEAFYLESGIPADRVHHVDVPNLEKGNVWPALNDEATRIAQQQWGINKHFHEMFQVKELWGVTDGTDHVGRVFSEELRGRVREAWHLGEDRDAEVNAWLAGRGVRIPPGEGRVLVLWSRFSGKATQWSDLRGRMEHDTSFQGVRQLLRNLAGDYKAVIITGDAHPDAGKGGKWDALVREMRTELGTDTIHQVTGFWRGTDPGLAAWGGDTRTGQFRLYDSLARQHGVQHLGFRSGNLEAVALIGHDVHYLEESGATGSHRMEAWHDADGTGTTRKGGLAPGYERVVIAEPPTASGRYGKQFDTGGPLEGTYQPADPGSWWRKPVHAYGNERGFGHADVQSIREELGLTGRFQDRDAFDADRVRHIQRRYGAVRAVVRQYGHLVEYDVEQYLAQAEAFFHTPLERYPHGPSQMYADFVEHVLPNFPAVWEVHRQIQTRIQMQAWEAYNRQQAGQGNGGEVTPRAPQSDTTGSPSGTTGTPSGSSGSTGSSGAGASAGVTPAEARARYGMPEGNFRKFQEVATRNRLRIDVRPTNPTAPAWLDQGKLPKPKDIKAKSINDLDTRLGAKAEHRGLIGYFRPVMPERGDTDAATWSRIEARFDQRTEEFDTLAPVMEALAAEGRFKVEDGLVYGRDQEGGWREITGDHDVFDISTPGSTRLKGSPYDRVVGEMMANDMAVMHGAHMDWEPSSPFSKGIFSKIVESHQEGGEPLLRFLPGVNDAELVHARPVLRPPSTAETPATPSESAPAPSMAAAPERAVRGGVRAPAAAPHSRVADLRGDEVAPQAPRTAPQEPAATSGRTGRPAPPAGPPLTRAVAFGAEDSTGLGPAEVGRLDALAAAVARGTVRHAEAGLPLPEVTIAGHGTASVAGRPHFGRAVQVGAERAEGVREVFVRRLDAHLRDLGSPLTASALSIARESRGSDLPHGTDPAHDTPEARRLAVVTVTHMPTERPPVRDDLPQGALAGRHLPDGPAPALVERPRALDRQGGAPDGQSAAPDGHRHAPDGRPPVRDVRAPVADEPAPPVREGRPPVRPEQWLDRRERAGWAVLRTERFDPARDPAAARPAPGALAGRDVVVRMAVARIQADDGRWVRNVSLQLPVRFGAGFGAGDLGAYRGRLQALLDSHINDGRTLPGSGDQLHIDVEVEHRPDHPEAIEISRSDQPVREWDQFTFPLGTREGLADDARALHELLHYAGLPDRYHDASTLFRRLERQADRRGVMAGADTFEVPDAYVRAIAAVTDSGPVLRDLPRTGAGAPGLSRDAARAALLAPDPEQVPLPRAPAAAPFAGRDRASVEDLVRRVLHDDTRMDHGRNWAGPGRPPLDVGRYAVVRDGGEGRTQSAPWTDPYVVMARAGGDHVTLRTPLGSVRLTEAEDFAALVANDPHRPPGADIVLAVRGLPEGSLGLPQAVRSATGSRVWTPVDATLRLVTVRGHRTTERMELSGSDPRWEATTTAQAADPFAHLRAARLVTDAYTTAAPGGSVLFQRLPLTMLEAFHAVDPADPDSPALVLPVQRFDEVLVRDRPGIEVSQDRTLAIDSGGLSRHAYATQQAVDDANVRLAAAGSKVRLAADPAVSLTLRRGDGLPHPPLLRIAPRFLTRSGRSDEEACRDFAQMVSGEVRASHVVFRAPGDRVATGRISALDTAEVTGTHHLAESLTRVAGGLVAPAATGPAWAAAQIGRDDRGVGGQGGAPLPGREYGGALSYEYADSPERDALTEAARRIGINEAAWAGVGEGYLVQSVNAANAEGLASLDVNYAKPGGGNGSHYGYHFASVVLASEDGRSQLTLENHARVGRTRAETTDAVEANLRQSAGELRSVEASLARRLRQAEDAGATAADTAALRARARLAEVLVAAKEARDRRAPAQDQERTLRQAATVLLKTAPMVEGREQWYFRAYSRRPGESMHETHAALLSDHDSAEANPLTLVVLHGHGEPLHRFIAFDESGAMADGGRFKLDQLAEHLVRVGLWNRDHGLPLPSVRLTGHGDGRVPHRDLELTAAMADGIRTDLRARIADLLRQRGSVVDASDFTFSVASGLHREDGTTRGREVTFDIDHWRSGDDSEADR